MRMSLGVDSLSGQMFWFQVSSSEIAIGQLRRTSGCVKRTDAGQVAVHYYDSARRTVFQPVVASNKYVEVRRGMS